MASLLKFKQNLLTAWHVETVTPAIVSNNNVEVHQN